MNTRRAHDRVELHCGDMLAVLPSLSADSIDACVTDPPYHLQSIHKRFAAKGRDETSERYAAGPYGRHATGFMGKQWDGGGVAFDPATWAEVFRVLKPGAHLLAFGGTRTSHRMACAIEDAGFEIRDTILWLYGSGFPKSHDVSKGIDRVLGGKRELVAPRSVIGHQRNIGNMRPYMLDRDHRTLSDVPVTDKAEEWDGWGTALKPACEPIILARKPLAEDTIAANVLKWGTGALNIDGCRIEGESWKTHTATGLGSVKFFTEGDTPEIEKSPHPLGRWPANIIHDGSEEVLAGFPDMHGAGCAQGKQEKWADQENKEGWGNIGLGPNGARFGDCGSAARFFYTAKADDDDRLGSKHPTVKPLDLIQYLVRLITPRDGLVLDPFAGTGTTGEAVFREGMRAVLIEREAEYQEDIRRRMANILSGPDERAREAIKQKLKDKPIDSGPLFGGT